MMKWQTHVHPRPVRTPERPAGHTGPKRHRSNIPACRFPPPVCCPAPCPSGKNRRHNSPPIPDRSDTPEIRFAQPRQSGPSGMLPVVPLCRLIENRYPQNRISVKPAARFVCPINFHRFLTFRNPPARQSPLVPDLRHPPERENTTGILHRSGPRFTRQPPLWQTGRSGLSGRNVFERKKGGNVQKTDGPTRHPQKKISS